MAARMSAAAFEVRFREEFDVGTGKRKLKCRSRKPIAELHESDEHLVDILRGRGDGSRKFPDSCSVERVEALVCLGCGRQMEDSEGTTVDGTIFHLLAPVPTRVEVWSCNCGRTWHYDGRGDGVLNFNDKYLFSYELLNWYSNQMWRTKYPFYTMWQAVLSMYAGSGLPPATLQRFVNLRSTFQDAWMDYITLQDIDYDTSFKCACPHPVGAAPEPECVIGDGIMLGYRGDLSFLVSPYEAVEGPLKTGSLHQKRIFVNDNVCRDLLLKFARPVGKAGAGLTEVELGGLETTVAAASFSSLRFLLKTPELENGRYHSSPMCRELLFGLATKSPVCAILPAEVEPIVEHLLENESHFFPDLGQARQLAARAPVLFDFVRAQHSVSGGRLTDECLQLLRDLLRVARQAYVEEPLAEVEKLKKKKLRDNDAAAGDPNGGRTPKDWSDEEAFLRTGHYFPNQPIWRPLQRYAADYFSQKVGPTCTKFKGKHKNVTPGMYPFFCTGCSKCVGFVVLSAAESPRVVFEVLFCRWRRLKMFIYDNVCHLHTYALNREASWAASVQWLIDWMHTVNHKECSPAYGIARYSILHNKNSQLSEQKNSRLVCMKAQAAFMGQGTFLHYGRYFLHCLNRQIDLGDLPVLPHLRN
ncbi:hypothetical protein KFL_000300160 [Klebsormidium nitens]|uniref:HMG domain-containing protein n=1 Tax=Klebsormidium nitens TaxID=105231 RepID=A0A0U9HRG2_KLENI|nr:hypothetical protein KFL_000300160 [Klebsormidium nitens]|eukprot:GAQ79418.1 hypothetical protein KFL_000300160 [Klebsormidium nitens]